jgi:DGQHR domain-containing protein
MKSSEPRRGVRRPSRESRAQRPDSVRGVLRFPALQIEQSDGRKVYCFAVDGKVLGTFAAVSRINRSSGISIAGYQRPEVLSHVKEIRRYIESGSPMIPNALVVAFNNTVHFEPTRYGMNYVCGTSIGELVVPVPPDGSDQLKPGWLVDGQQRAAAIRDARVSRFPIYVTAFIATTEAEQRAQFILVNSTKPLPKGLIHELLPSTDDKLSTALERQRFPTVLLERLNHDLNSPFYRKIKTPTNGEGVIKDNSVLRMLGNSLREGCLYRYRDRDTGYGDERAMLGLLFAYWTAVSLVFPDAWTLPPRRSRLVHGAGIISMGFLMDAICEARGTRRSLTPHFFVRELFRIKDVCSWTSGEWTFGGGRKRKWSDIENTSNDIQALSALLVGEYERRAR